MKKLGLGVACLLLAACAKKNIDNPDAVRSAVMEYLTARQAQTGLDLATMDVQIGAMAFEKDSARTTVTFKIKGTESGMQMNYQLDRSGDKWVVHPQTDNLNPHAVSNGVPGDDVDGARKLPPGHPNLDPSGKAVEK